MYSVYTHLTVSPMTSSKTIILLYMILHAIRIKGCTAFYYFIYLLYIFVNIILSKISHIHKTYPKLGCLWWLNKHVITMHCLWYFFRLSDKTLPTIKDENLIILRHFVFYILYFFYMCIKKCQIKNKWNTR